MNQTRVGCCLAALLTAAIVVLPQLSFAAAAEQRPNVLLISIDDLNDWVGCLGGHPQAQTPHIDRLAKRGVLFANAHCQSPVCTPSRASMMTSRLPSSTGLYFLQPHLHMVETTKNRVTLAERFAADGYKTLGVGKVYGGHEQRYFQIYGGNKGGFGPRPKEKISHPVGHPLWDWGAYPDSDSQMPDHKIADWAIERLKQSHETPFLLAVGFFRPHVPLYAPRSWFRRHPLEKIQVPQVLKNDRDDLPQYARDLTIGFPAPRHEWFVEHGEWKHAVQAYLATTTFVDHQVGRVLAALDSSRHAKNTVIVLFSDHGWHLGEKQRWAKRSLWEDSTRVPLIVAAPNVKPDRRSDRPVGLIDIYPTLLDLCRLKADPEHEGRSLVPLLEDPTLKWEHPAITTFGPHNHAVRSTRWRYIHYADGSEELYDHRTDPHEWHNLAADKQHADVLAAHRQRLPKGNLPALRKYDSSGLKAWLDAEAKRKVSRN